LPVVTAKNTHHVCEPLAILAFREFGIDEKKTNIFKDVLQNVD
jgi:hypothetical protein